VGSLLALEAMDEEAPIRLYINSPGGTPYSVIGVVDAMQQVKCPIQTVALGACYSYSSLILVREAGIIVQHCIMQCVDADRCLQNMVVWHCLSVALPHKQLA
jgi:ATP-dependent protease ClpP protease subunit